MKFRIIPIPPKYEKTQAVQVTVLNEDQLLEQGRRTWAQSNEELKGNVVNKNSQGLYNPQYTPLLKGICLKVYFLTAWFPQYHGGIFATLNLLYQISR